MRSTMEVSLVSLYCATGPTMVTVAPPSGQVVPTAGTSTCRPCCWVYLTKSLKHLVDASVTGLYTWYAGK